MHLLKYCIYFIDLFLNLLAASVAFMYTMSLLQIDNHLFLQSISYNINGRVLLRMCLECTLGSMRTFPLRTYWLHLSDSLVIRKPDRLSLNLKKQNWTSCGSTTLSQFQIPWVRSFVNESHPAHLCHAASHWYYYTLRLKLLESLHRSHHWLAEEMCPVGVNLFFWSVGACVYVCVGLSLTFLRLTHCHIDSNSSGAQSPGICPPAPSSALHPSLLSHQRRAFHRLVCFLLLLTLSHATLPPPPIIFCYVFAYSFVPIGFHVNPM